MADGLFCDGGVIQKNPSPLGGTYAYCLVEQDKRVWERAGVIGTDESGTPAVTNNLTEMLAVFSAPNPGGRPERIPNGTPSLNKWVKGVDKAI